MRKVLKRGADGALSSAEQAMVRTSAKNAALPAASSGNDAMAAARITQW
jgi:hypothetical protein